MRNHRALRLEWFVVLRPQKYSISPRLTGQAPRTLRGSGEILRLLRTALLHVASTYSPCAPLPQTTPPLTSRNKLRSLPESESFRPPYESESESQAESKFHDPLSSKRREPLSAKTVSRRCRRCSPNLCPTSVTEAPNFALAGTHGRYIQYTKTRCQREGVTVEPPTSISTLMKSS